MYNKNGEQCGQDLFFLLLFHYYFVLLGNIDQANVFKFSNYQYFTSGQYIQRCLQTTRKIKTPVDDRFMFSLLVLLYYCYILNFLVFLINCELQTKTNYIQFISIFLLASGLLNMGFYLPKKIFRDVEPWFLSFYLFVCNFSFFFFQQLCALLRTLTNVQ